jgi:subtilisin family serine protease
LAARNYVSWLDTAEEVSEPQNDAARATMNVEGVWSGGDTGAGVTIAVLDSGIDTSNPDFPTLNATNSKDYSNYPSLDDTITNTVTGHGSHVAGSLLGRGVNSSTYKGVAPGANLVFLKIGNDTDGNALSGAITYAIRDAVDVYHAKIISMSYGGWSAYHDGSDQDSQAVDYATSRGATVFISSGNAANKGRHFSGTIAANSTSSDIP